MGCMRMPHHLQHGDNGLLGLAHFPLSYCAMDTTNRKTHQERRGNDELRYLQAKKALARARRLRERAKPDRKQDRATKTASQLVADGIEPNPGPRTGRRHRAKHAPVPPPPYRRLPAVPEDHPFFTSYAVQRNLMWWNEETLEYRFCVGHLAVMVDTGEVSTLSDLESAERYSAYLERCCPDYITEEDMLATGWMGQAREDGEVVKFYYAAPPFETDFGPVDWFRCKLPEACFNSLVDQFLSIQEKTETSPDGTTNPICCVKYHFAGIQGVPCTISRQLQDVVVAQASQLREEFRAALAAQGRDPFESMYAVDQPLRCLTREEIVTMLLAGGIEPNPGPEPRGKVPRPIRGTRRPPPLFGGARSKGPTGPDPSTTTPGAGSSAQHAAEAWVLAEHAVRMQKPPVKGQEKAYQHKAKRAKIGIARVVEAVEAETQKLEGAADARADAATADREEEEDAKALEQLQEFDRIETFIRFIPRSFFVLYLPQEAKEPVNFLPEWLGAPHLQCLQTKLDAALSFEHLPRPVGPHVVLHYSQINAEDIDGGDGAEPQGGIREGETQPGSIAHVQRDSRLRRDRITKYLGPSTQIQYVVERENFTFAHQGMGGPVVVGTVRLTFDRLFALLNHRAGRSGMMHVTLENVQMWLSRDRMDSYGASDLGQVDYYHDLAMAALIHLSVTPVRFPVTAGDVTEETLARKALASWSDFTGGVITPGTSIIGYDVTPDDIFTQPLKDVVEQNFGMAVREVKQKFRAGMQYARAYPIHVPGFFAHFPNPFTRLNVMCGALKRIGVRRLQATPEMIARYEKCIEHLCRMIVPTRRMLDSSVLFECRAHATAKGFKGDDLDAYMLGANEALCGVVPPAIELRHYASFVKAEAMQHGALKTPRFIAAPSFKIRGYLHALLYRAQHNFFEAMSAHSVKGKDMSELDRELQDKMGGLAWFHCTDFTSMEANVQRYAIVGEGEVLGACDPEARGAICEVFRILAAGRNTMASRFYDFVVTPMRMSGQDHTSVGNYINNFAWSFAIMSKFHNVPVEGVSEYVRSYEHPYFFEGDDGVLHVGVRHSEAELETLGTIAGEMGVRLKFEQAAKISDASFCKASTYSVQVPVSTGDAGAGSSSERVFRTKDPITVLASLFTAIGKNTHLMRVEDQLKLQVATAMSYLHSFPDLPIVAPVCRAILEKYSSVMNRVRDELGEETGSFSLREALGEMKIRAREKGQDISQWGVDTWRRVSPEAREQVERLYRIPGVVQRAVEEKLVQQIREGRRKLECDELVTISRSCGDAWRRMKEIKTEDLRARAASFARAAKTVVTPVTTMNFGEIFTRVRVGLDAIWAFFVAFVTLNQVAFLSLAYVAAMYVGMTIFLLLFVSLVFGLKRGRLVAGVFMIVGLLLFAVPLIEISWAVLVVSKRLSFGSARFRAVLARLYALTTRIPNTTLTGWMRRALNRVRTAMDFHWNDPSNLAVDPIIVPEAVNCFRRARGLSAMPGPRGEEELGPYQEPTLTFDAATQAIAAGRAFVVQSKKDAQEAVARAEAEALASIRALRARMHKF